MFPKAITLVSILALVVAVQAQDAPQVLSVGTGAEAAVLDSSNLMKRACVYDGCACNISRGGLACYGGNVYQCSPEGKCCNFGPRKSCQTCGQPQC